MTETPAVTGLIPARVEHPVLIAGQTSNAVEVPAGCPRLPDTGFCEAGASFREDLDEGSFELVSREISFVTCLDIHGCALHAEGHCRGTFPAIIRLE